MKKYSEDLLQKLKERQSTQDYYGMEIVCYFESEVTF